MLMKALIFDIKRFAIHDGPGIRTTVFFKGCPLRCPWCHNPEGIEPKKEIIAFEDRCIWCGDCIGTCTEEAISLEGKRIAIDRDRCTMCGECERVCPSQAIRIVGREISLEELIEEVEKDRVFYENSGGGVTFSGGEPLMQCRFLIEALKECRSRGIHTACDTSGYSQKDCILEAGRYTELFLYDLKHMDSEVHRKFTGVGNELIIENLRAVTHAGALVRVRVPVVRGFNESLENAERTAEFLSKLKGIDGVSIIKYHSSWIGKFRDLDKKYKPYLLDPPSDETLRSIAAVFERYGFLVRLGN